MGVKLGCSKAPGSQKKFFCPKNRATKKFYFYFLFYIFYLTRSTKKINKFLLIIVLYNSSETTENINASLLIWTLNFLVVRPMVLIKNLANLMRYLTKYGLWRQFWTEHGARDRGISRFPTKNRTNDIIIHEIKLKKQCIPRNTVRN